MKRKGKRKTVVVIACIFLLLGAAWVSSVDKINDKNDYPAILYHELGESVALDDNMLAADFVNMQGYEVAVNGSKLYTIEEYLEKYDLTLEEYISLNGYNSLGEYAWKFLVPSMILEVEISLSNTNNQDTGVNFEWWSLVGSAAYSQLDTYLYSLANPQMQGSTMARAKLNSSAELRLPFGIKQSDMSRKTWKQLDCTSLYLVISDFPTSHRLAIS